MFPPSKGIHNHEYDLVERGLLARTFVAGVAISSLSRNERFIREEARREDDDRSWNQEICYGEQMPGNIG